MKFLPTHPSRFEYFDIQRRAVANKTLEGWTTVPHVSGIIELDVTHLLRLVEDLKVHPDYLDMRVTLNSLMLKIFALGIQHAPHMNAHIEYNRHNSVGGVTLFDEINIAVPFRTNDGRMITPVLQNAGKLSLRGLCGEMDALKKRVAKTSIDLLLREAAVGDSVRKLLKGDLRILWRIFSNFIGPARLKRVSADERRRWRETPREERITPENIFSATILVSNVGGFVGGNPTSITMLDIIPPQTTAIGLGSVVRRPRVVVRNGAEVIEPRSVVPMTICFDHRALDFEHVRPFILRVCKLCADPRELDKDIPCDWLEGAGEIPLHGGIPNPAGC